jgi:hypothetical protein
MKIVDKDGKEIKEGDLILVEDDGVTKKEDFDPAKWVRQARAAASESAARRKELETANEQLEKYKGEDGEYLDPELAAAAIARGDKAIKDKDGLEAQLQAANDKWQGKLDTETGKLTKQLASLKGAQNEAALLGSKDLQGTIFAKMGARHLVTEFGALINDDGHPVGRDGKPIMSDDDPTRPATIAEAAPLWISSHPDGKDKIMLDTFSGGAGGAGGSGGSGGTGKSGYAGIIAGAKK